MPDDRGEVYNDTPLKNLRTAYSKIKSAQRNLIYAQVSSALVEELIQLKTKVIKEYEARGGTWGKHNE